MTLVAHGHTTVDRGELSFEQIIPHHNATLDGFDAGRCVVGVRPADQIVF